MMFPQFLTCTLAGLIAFGASPKDSPSGPGYSYKHEAVSEVPWSIHVLQIDRAAKDLQLQTILANGTSFGLNSLQEQLSLVPSDLGRPIAAINGDFYNNQAPYQGDPKGLQIMRGELVSAPNDWTCMWIDAGGEPHMGRVTSQFSVTWPNGSTSKLGLNERCLPSAAVLYTPAIGSSTHTSSGREFILEPSASTPLPLKPDVAYSFRVKEIRPRGNSQLAPGTVVLAVGPTLSRSLPPVETGATLRISTAVSPSISGATTALSGGPALVHEKKAVYNYTEQRHPRSAFGWNSSHFFFVEVDGRQPELSLGMTYREFSDYLVKIGCEEAMNLDGGGSATLWVLGQVINSPCEGHARSVANALVLFETPKAPTESSNSNH